MLNLFWRWNFWDIYLENLKNVKILHIACYNLAKVDVTKTLCTFQAMIIFFYIWDKILFLLSSYLRICFIGNYSSINSVQVMKYKLDIKYVTYKLQDYLCPYSNIELEEQRLIFSLIRNRMNPLKTIFSRTTMWNIKLVKKQIYNEHLTWY